MDCTLLTYFVTIPSVHEYVLELSMGPISFLKVLKVDHIWINWHDTHLAPISFLCLPYQL